MKDPKITPEELKKVPYKLLASELARRNSEKAVKARRAAGTLGRPKVLKPCPVCQEMLTAVSRRKHSPAWCRRQKEKTT